MNVNLIKKNVDRDVMMAIAIKIRMRFVSKYELRDDFVDKTDEEDEHEHRDEL